MLWLCIYLPQLSLEALAPPKEHAVAIIVNEKNKRRIIACNAAATKAGISNATALTTAFAIYPSLRALERNAKAELTALKRLAAWAYQWSSRVTWQEGRSEFDSYAATLWLEIGASRALFGGYVPLVQQLEQSLRLLEYSYRLGIAPTVEGAALLARAGKRLFITSQEHLLITLRKLPIAYLALQRDILHALQRSGITHIDALLNLPTTAIARRFGPDVTLHLERLCGNAPDPRTAYRLPKRYRERCDFGFGVCSVEPLLFPLQRMLHEFCGYLRAADIATQQYTVVLEHEQRAVTRVVIGLASPSRDVDRLFSLTKEKLHNFALSADVYGLRIEAKEFLPPAVRQNNLFSGTAQLADQIADELQQVLEKVTARLGQDTVHTLQTIADHRPEHAWRFCTQPIATGSIPGTTKLTPARPLWILSQPQRLQTQPNINTQPERIEGGWWAGPVNRDYYIAHPATGECCWVFFNQDDQQWYLHGYWA